MIGDSCGIYVPNIFTPNGDGTNDMLNIMCSCLISDFEFEVKKNRKIIFQTTDQSSSWDGTCNGEFQTGVFDYSISGKIDGLNFSNNGEITCLPNLYDVVYIIENCENCNTGSQFSGGILVPQLPSGELICN
jgi:gliding motility-associated-like protein